MWLPDPACGVGLWLCLGTANACPSPSPRGRTRELPAIEQGWSCCSNTWASPTQGCEYCLRLSRVVEHRNRRTVASRNLADASGERRCQVRAEADTGSGYPSATQLESTRMVNGYTLRHSHIAESCWTQCRTNQSPASTSSQSTSQHHQQEPKRYHSLRKRHLRPPNLKCTTKAWLSSSVLAPSMFSAQSRSPDKRHPRELQEAKKHQVETSASEHS